MQNRQLCCLIKSYIFIFIFGFEKFFQSFAFILDPCPRRPQHSIKLSAIILIRVQSDTCHGTIGYLVCKYWYNKGASHSICTYKLHNINVVPIMYIMNISLRSMRPFFIFFHDLSLLSTLSVAIINLSIRKHLIMHAKSITDTSSDT